MKAKVILSFIITFVVILNTTALALTNNQKNEMRTLGIIPNEIKEGSLNRSVTREVFVYMAIKLISREEVPPNNTRFSDVDNTNPYSGYIELAAGMGFISEKEDGTFDSDAPVSKTDAAKIVLTILNYSKLADMEGGYLYWLSALGLDVGVTTDTNGNLTNESAANIIYAALTTPITEVTYSTVNGQDTAVMSQTKSTILSKGLGINVYEGVITSVNVKNHSIVFTAKRNMSAYNDAKVEYGDVSSFTLDGGISIYDYAYAPVTIWVDKNEKVVHISLSKNITVKFGVVTSINGDENIDSAYVPQYMKRLMLLDDEEKYDIVQDVGFRWNGQIDTAAQKLIGKTIRMVLDDNEIIHIEGWDLKEGGLITKTNQGVVSYMKGEIEFRLTEFSYYNTKLFFINGESRSQNELKTNAVFDYYEAGDYLVMVVSEKAISDKFLSVSNDALEIGNLFVSRENQVYFSTDGITFKDKRDYLEYTGLIVTAYFSPNGKVRYVVVETDPEQMNLNFYGAVTGVDWDNFRDTGRIELWVLGQEPSKEVFILDKKRTKYLDGLAYDNLAANVRSLDGNGVFHFEADRTGVIRAIKKPRPYYGFGADIDTKVAADISIFAGTNTANVIVNGLTVYFNSPIIGLYEADGEFCARAVEWGQLVDRTAGGAKLTFYGEDKTPDPDIVMLTGNISGIGSYYPYCGIITKRHTVLKEDGTIGVKLFVADASGESDYLVTEETASKVSDNTFIRYYNSLIFSTDEISIIDQIDLSRQHYEWDNINLVSVIVEKADERRVYFDNGMAQYMHPTLCAIVSVREESPENRFQGGLSYKDIEPSDRIFYYTLSGAIRLIIVVK